MPDIPSSPPADPTTLLGALVRLAEGTLDAAEQSELQEHLAAHAEDARLARALAAARMDEGVATDAELVERVAMVCRPSDVVTSGPPRRRRLSRGISSAYAFAVMACVVLVCTAVVGLVVPGIRHRLDSSSGHPYHTYATHIGQRATITLRDGSRVTLAPVSTLRIQDDFGRTNHHVMLDGEAYFTVAPGTQAPFVVHTGVITTRVLGTAFDVAHYGGDPGVRIVVASGKVAVAAPRRAPIALTANTVTYVTDSTVQSANVPDVNDYTAWQSGRLVFREAPVVDVLAAVGRWYGYELRLTDPALGFQRVTTTLEGHTRSGVLLALENLLDVTLTMSDTGHVITLSPRRGAAPSGRTRRAIHDSLSLPLEEGR